MYMYSVRSSSSTILSDPVQIQLGCTPDRPKFGPIQLLLVRFPYTSIYFYPFQISLIIFFLIFYNIDVRPNCCVLMLNIEWPASFNSNLFFGAYCVFKSASLCITAQQPQFLTAKRPLNT
jgi:hypothetical protein